MSLNLSLLSSCEMSRIFAAIVHSYPSLTAELSSLPSDEASDSRVMGTFASHVVHLFEATRDEELRPAFELVEDLIASGTEAEKHAAVVGFLETVQNVASHRDFGDKAFEPFLGPKSQAAWAELNVQWKGKMTLAEVVASETGAILRPPWWQFWKRRKERTPRELLEEVQDPELRRIIEQITRE